MSTIREGLSCAPTSRTRGERIAQYLFLALCIALVAYSTGSTFAGQHNRLNDYMLAICASMLATNVPGCSRAIPGASFLLRLSEWGEMASALVCAGAVIVGDITDRGAQPTPFNAPTLVAMGALAVALCLHLTLVHAKARSLRRGLIPPRS